MTQLANESIFRRAKTFVRVPRTACFGLAVVALLVAGCGVGGDDSTERTATDEQKAAWEARSRAVHAEQDRQRKIEDRLRQNAARQKKNEELRRQNEKLRQQVARQRAQAARQPRTAPTPATPGRRAPAASTGVQNLVSGQVGVAYGPPGQSPTIVGDLLSGPGWSTMKVPVAIAFSQRNGGTATPGMTAAITRSDNASAVAMWDSLGSPSQAGAAVQRVLAAGGDTGTTVQTRVVRSGFTSFGQTDWGIAAQQTFAQNMACIQGAAPVVRLMGQVESSQRWGLGSVGSSQHFKGGWGPDPGGKYLVRQFGTIRVPSGVVAVAIAVRPADGQFGTGTAELTRVAQWVAKNAQGGTPTC